MKRPNSDKLAKEEDEAGKPRIFLSCQSRSFKYIVTDRKKRKLSPVPPPAAAAGGDVKPKVAAIKTEGKTLPAKASDAVARRAVVPGKVAPVAGTKPLPPTTKPAVGGKPLPAFAKRKPAPPKVAPKPVAPTPAPAPTAAAFDPFATALSDMVRQKEEQQGGMSLGAQLNMVNNAIASASSGPAGALSASNMVPRAGKKQKKSVRWESQENLLKVKYVEVLVYGDENGNEIASSDYFNTTGESSIGEGEAEGVALASLAEEMDWEEPQRT